MSFFKGKIIRIFTLLNIIAIISFNFYTVRADDLDEEDENFEIVQETISEVSSNLTDEIVLNSRECVVYDRISKTVIYGKNENVKSAMASTTKIMTATIVLENANLAEVVTVSSKAAGTGGSRLGLKKRR